MERPELKMITDQHKSLQKDFSVIYEKNEGLLFAIDGRDDAGKTNLAAFVSWQFDIPVISTDNFISTEECSDGSSPVNLKYNRSPLDQAIRKRLDKNKPVIVEGICVLKTLEGIGHKPHFLIYVENTSFNGTEDWRDDFLEYEKKYFPRKKANSKFSRSE